MSRQSKGGCVSVCTAGRVHPAGRCLSLAKTRSPRDLRISEGFRSRHLGGKIGGCSSSLSPSSPQPGQPCVPAPAWPSRIQARGLALDATGPHKPPSQTWRTFLTNHVGTLASIDFFTVPTATFRVLYVFVVLAHDRRRVVHFSVTEHPTAAWTARQIVEAFPEACTPTYLMRDRDQIYGEPFRDRLAGMGIEEVLSAPRSPWQNPFVERLIGSARRECLDHMVVLGEECRAYKARSHAATMAEMADGVSAPHSRRGARRRARRPPPRGRGLVRLCG